MTNHGSQPAPPTQFDAAPASPPQQGDPDAQIAGSAMEASANRSASDRAYDATHRDVEALQKELTGARKDLAHARKQIETLFEKLGEFGVARAPAEAKSVALLARGKQIRSDLQELTAELQAWNTRFRALMASDEGKKIVTAGAHLDFFSALSQKARPSEADIGVWNEQLAKLLDPLESAAANENQTFVPTEDYLGLIDEIAKTTRAALDELKQDRKLLDVVLRDTAKLTPADMTLDDALARRTEEEARLFSQRVAQSRQQAVQSASRILETAEADRVAASAAKQKQIIDNERQRLELETQGLKNAAVAEKEAFAAQQAKERLLREMAADMDEIQSVLRPFLDPGFTQPRDYANFNSTLEKKPMSFSQIQGAGALENTMQGLVHLLSVGTAKGNDRPTGGFPVFHYIVPTTRLPDFVEKDPKLRARLQRAQELLTKYGPLMVERKMLSP